MSSPISTVQKRLERLWQGSVACVVAVYPLSKSSLHQRPVYQHHLEKKVPLKSLPTAPRGHVSSQHNAPSYRSRRPL